MIEDHNDCSLSNISQQSFDVSKDDGDEEADDDEEFEYFDSELFDEAAYIQNNGITKIIDFGPSGCDDSQDDLDISSDDNDEDQSLSSFTPPIRSDASKKSNKNDDDSSSTDQIPKQILQQLQQLSPEMQKQMLPQILATLQVNDIKTIIPQQQQQGQEPPTGMDIQSQPGIPSKNSIELHSSQQQQLPQSNHPSPFYTTATISSRQPHQVVTSFQNSTMMSQEQHGFQNATTSSTTVTTPCSQMMDNRTFPLYPVQEIQNQIQQLQVSNGALSSTCGPQQTTTNTTAAASIQYLPHHHPSPQQAHYSNHLYHTNNTNDSGGVGQQQDQQCISVENTLDHLDCNAINAMKSSIEEEIEKTQKLVQSQKQIVKSQLNVMEKLSESMKRSAMSRNMVHQLSGRSVASDSDSSDFIVLGSPGGPQGSSSSLSFRGLARQGSSSRNLGSSQGSISRLHGSSSRSLGSSSGGPGRGFGRPIAVSGRGRNGRSRSRGRGGSHGQQQQRQGSWRNIPNGNDIILDGKLNPSSQRRSHETMYRPTEAGFVRSIPDRGLFKHHSNPTVMATDSATTIPTIIPTLIARPGRGLRRNVKSNPTIGHRLQQLERGAMDMNYDGLSDADSV